MLLGPAFNHRNMYLHHDIDKTIGVYADNRLTIQQNQVILDKMSGVKLETTPVDPRFPNTNQAQHCWTRYNEWVLCQKKHKDDESACVKARHYAQGICPNE